MATLTKRDWSSYAWRKIYTAINDLQTGTFAALSVGTAEIAALAVTTAKIALLAVDSAQLADSAVATAKIAALAVDETKLIGTIASAPQALSGAGAINVTARTTLFTSTGGAQALTMAAGTRTGQRKTVIHTVDGGSGVITPTSPGNLATATLTNVRDWVEFEWSGTVWNVVGYSGSTFT